MILPVVENGWKGIPFVVCAFTTGMMALPLFAVLDAKRGLRGVPARRHAGASSDWATAAARLSGEALCRAGDGHSRSL
jgi:hypothetical protein